MSKIGKAAPPVERSTSVHLHSYFIRTSATGLRAKHNRSMSLDIWLAMLAL